MLFQRLFSSFTALILVAIPALSQTTPSFFDYDSAGMADAKAQYDRLGLDEVDYLIRFFSKTPDDQPAVSIVQYTQVIEQILKIYPKGSGVSIEKFTVIFNELMGPLREELGIDEKSFTTQVAWILRIRTYEAGILNAIRSHGFDADRIQRALEDERDFTIPVSEGVWKVIQAQRGY